MAAYMCTFWRDVRPTLAACRSAIAGLVGLRMAYSITADRFDSGGVVTGLFILGVCDALG